MLLTENTQRWGKDCCTAGLQFKQMDWTKEEKMLFLYVGSEQCDQ